MQVGGIVWVWVVWRGACVWLEAGRGVSQGVPARVVLNRHRTGRE